MKKKMSRKMRKMEKNDYYFWKKCLSHKMSEYKFWVVKNGELHLFRNPHENFEPDSSEMEWGVLKNINFHDDEKTTWNEGEEEDNEEEEEEEDKEEDEEEEEKKEESETKNVKENRKVVVANYFCQGIFKIPDGLDLNDETVVNGWTVRYETLYIYYVDGRKEEIESHVDTEPDWKMPDIEVKDADDYCVEYSEDEEEEEDCVYNFYLCKFCCSEYDETEVDCKHCGRNRCVFTYQAKNKSQAIAMTKE